MAAAKKGTKKCKCGAPVIYSNPDKRSGKLAARKIRFDVATKKSYTQCEHGNEFEYTKVNS